MTYENQSMVHILDYYEVEVDSKGHKARVRAIFFCGKTAPGYVIPTQQTVRFASDTLFGVRSEADCSGCHHEYDLNLGEKPYVLDFDSHETECKDCGEYSLCSWNLITKQWLCETCWPTRY